jgi:hypothetical protein
MESNRDREASPWVDTATKAILQSPPPMKYTESGTLGFTLVLLKRGLDRDRLARALERICREPERPITGLLDGSCPAVVLSGLTLDEAVLGQFELICCDCVSVFLRDEIVAQDDSHYLSPLYSQLRSSPEFQPIYIGVSFIPDTDSGRRFCDQFLPPQGAKRIRYGAEIAIRECVARKKGRIMAHWAREIGVRLTIET